MDLKTQVKTQLIQGLDLEDIEPGDIQDDQPLFAEGLGLDSLDAVELVVIIQKHFNVEITDMEQGKNAFTSINALTKFIEENQSV